ncbi:MAG: hypothetical protein JJE04_27100 [Acidobacteriia bacterium]|nr:hypothetical protein [Terriglobia bacterium]
MVDAVASDAVLDDKPAEKTTPDGQPPALPTEVWINPPPKSESAPSDSERKAQ